MHARKQISVQVIKQFIKKIKQVIKTSHQIRVYLAQLQGFIPAMHLYIVVTVDDIHRRFAKFHYSEDA